MRFFRFASVLIFLSLSAAVASAADTNDYDVSHYELSFRTRSNSADVDVTMEITYAIRSGTKSAGFKYVAFYGVSNFSGKDEYGKAIRVWVDNPRETRLNWSFDPAGPGEKKIRLIFTISAALSGDLDSNTLDAAWAGVFRVPVHDAVYRLVLPDDSERTYKTSRSVQSSVEDGKRVLEVHQSPVQETAFRVEFSPGLVQSYKTPPAVATTGESSPGIDISAFIRLLTFFVFIVWVVSVIAWLVKKSQRAGRRGGKGGWGDASGVSSCAGASSCGGGCGGGGCGGGCGG